MQFQRLLDALDALTVLYRSAENADVTSPVVEDHRLVQPGGLFVARKGESFDGHEVIEEAIARGAAAIVGERPPDAVKCAVPYAQVRDAQMAIGPLAAAFYDYPSRKLTIIGVTGTDGKTTTTTLIFSILQAAGIRAGMISTVSAVIGDEEMPTGLHVTTPHAPEVQMYLWRMVNAGLTHCVLETTSHGLAQGRVRGVDYDVAVLTNVTHEHLDEHGTFESYRAAKGLLFKNLGESFRKPGIQKWAIVNLDDPSAHYFLAFPADVHVAYGIDRESQIHADISARANFEPQITHMAIRTHLSKVDVPLLVKTPLVGAFNVQNILAAVGAAYAVGCSQDAIRTGIEKVPPIPGRMERIDEGQDFLAIVDFAHTPNALRRALEAARLMILPEQRVIAVFGSAGLRDREKRRLMAEVSAELADISVFTAEDPRTESLDAILRVMANAAISKGGIEGQTFHRVRDRGAALAFACSLARPGDLVMACGKGHEQSMAFGTIEYPWDDREALRAALRGQPLKTLPTANQE
jgi:UDP-N-acetylmuramoyl-L-alanyl-D-glutamate--2,6-diaminopimelate ligase